MQTKFVAATLAATPTPYTFTGRANRGDVPDLVNEIVAQGAWANDLQEKGPVRPLFWMHDSNEILGVVHVAEDPHGLIVTNGVLVEGVRRADEAWALLSKTPGAIGGMSVGFLTLRDRFLRNGVREIQEARLYEVSLVAHPASPGSTIDPVNRGLGELSALIAKMNAEIRTGTAHDLRDLLGVLARARKSMEVSR